MHNNLFDRASHERKCTQTAVERVDAETDMARDSDSVRERLVRGVKASLVAQVLSILSNTLLIVVLTRLFLSPTGFGRLNFALSVLAIVGNFAILGLPKSTARYLTEFLEEDETQIPYILRTSLLALGTLVGIASLLLALTSGKLASLLGQPALAPLLLIGATYVVVYATYSYVTTIFQGFNRITWSAGLTALANVGRIVFAVGLLLAGLGVIGALVGYVLGYALASAVGAVLLYRHYYTRFEETSEPEAGLKRRILEYSLPLTVTKSAGVLDKRVDIILVGALLNPAAVGYYVVAKQVSSVVTTPASSFGFTLSPALGEQKASDHIDRARELYQQSLNHVLLFYVPAVTGLVLVADPLIRFVFGTQYLPAIRVLQVFGGFVLVNSITRITGSALDYLGRARARAKAKAVMAVSNFVLNLILIPVLGVVGAALATVITHTFYTSSNLYVINQELSLDFRPVVHNLAVIATVTVGMVGAVLLTLPYASGLPSLLGIVLFGGVVWLTLSVLSGLLDVQQLRSLL